jgi:hypothetical protein
MRSAEVDPEKLEAWSCLLFPVGNPRADGAADLPRLLRRLAGSIEERGSILRRSST